jgi:hypothetical protein
MLSRFANQWRLIFVASWLAFSTAGMAQSPLPSIGQFMCPGNVLIEIFGLGYQPDLVPQHMKLVIGTPTKITRVSTNIPQNVRSKRVQAYVALDGHARFYVYPPISGEPAQAACGSSPAPAPTAPAPTSPYPKGSELGKALEGKMRPTESPEKLVDLVWSTVLRRCQRPELTTPSIFFLQIDNSYHVPGSPETRKDFFLTELGGPFHFDPTTVKRTFTEAEKRNTGIQWEAHSALRSTVYQLATMKLWIWDDNHSIDPEHSSRGPGLWSGWMDSPGNQEQGTISLTIRLDKNGVYIADDGLPGQGITSSPNLQMWQPVSCEAMLAADPFATFTKGVPKQTLLDRDQRRPPTVR